MLRGTCGTCERDVVLPERTRPSVPSVITECVQHVRLCFWMDGSKNRPWSFAWLRRLSSAVHSATDWSAANRFARQVGHHRQTVRFSPPHALQLLMQVMVSAPLVTGQSRHLRRRVAARSGPPAGVAPLSRARDARGREGGCGVGSPSSFPVSCFSYRASGAYQEQSSNWKRVTPMARRAAMASASVGQDFDRRCPGV